MISNDELAIYDLAMKSLKDAGIKMPEYIAIVGFNNDTVSRIVEPTLTPLTMPEGKWEK